MEFEWGRAADHCLRTELLPGKVLLTGYAGRKDAVCFPQNREKQINMLVKDPYWYRQWAPKSLTPQDSKRGRLDPLKRER